MATNSGTLSGLLLGVAVALAAQIPTTVQAIPDPTTRSVVQVGILVVVVICAVLVRPREVANMVAQTAIAVRNSLRPASAKTPNVEGTSILPPARGPIEFDIPDLGLEEPAPKLETRTPTVPPPPSGPRTPPATPNAKK